MKLLMKGLGVRAALAIVGRVGQVRRMGGLRRLRRMGGLGRLGRLGGLGMGWSRIFFWVLVGN